MLSQVLAPTCSCDSARLSFSSSIMICFMMFEFSDVSVFENILFENIFLRTLTTSHGITR